MKPRIEIQLRPPTPAAHRPTVEICEHKGNGHPDTLTDGACEAASRELSLAYRRQCGRVLHHNLDKGLLIAGRSEPRFGGGRILAPMRWVICGRATPLPDGTALADLIAAALQRQVREQAGLETDAAQVSVAVGETSDPLRLAFGTAVVRANDTSFGVGFAPHTALERCVLELAGQVRAAPLRAAFPAVGADFKIMGLRRGEQMQLTLALALVDRHVESVAHYFAIKAALARTLAATLPPRTGLQINALDWPDARDESGLYLTVTGLSAEMGDDGQVGRGNRVNGLITPGRPMSLEAAAGKNPVSHVGKLYNVLAQLIARDIQSELGGVQETTVQLLAAIGNPVDQPQIASIEIVCARALGAAARAQAGRIADRWLADIGRVTDMILDQRVSLY